MEVENNNKAQEAGKKTAENLRHIRTMVEYQTSEAECGAPIKNVVPGFSTCGTEVKTS